MTAVGGPVTAALGRVAFAVTFVVHSARSDPGRLVVQAARRLPPRWSARAVPLAQRCADALDARPAGRLRAAWRRGDLAAVRTAAPATAAARRVQAGLLAEAALLAPWTPPTPPTPSARRHAAAPAHPAVHHHLTNSLPHTQSGYTLRSHGLLTAQAAAGWRVTATTRPGYPRVVGRFAARPADPVDAVTYARLLPARYDPDPAARREAGVALLDQAVRAARPDLIHTTTPAATGEAARAVAARLGLPWVYEVRGLPELTWAASQPTAADRVKAAASERFALIRAQETDLARAADQVVTLSATMRDDLVARGVAADKVTLAPNAVDAALLARPAIAPAAARRALGLDLGPEVVGAVGSLVGYEGLDLVVRLVARLRAEGRDVGGLIVGDGAARPGLVRLAAELGVAGHVAFPGAVPRTAAPAWVEALDLVLIPRRPDPVANLVTPLKPVEAMALGRPVVASDLPALAEATAGAAVLVAPAPAADAGTDVDAGTDAAGAWADAVTRLLDGPAERADRVAAGRAVAAGRTWPRLLDVYRAVYGRALGQGGAADAGGAGTLGP